jgi:hypothetical protein
MKLFTSPYDYAKGFYHMKIEEKSFSANLFHFNGEFQVLFMKLF